jgi:hypothetical protein
MESYGFGINLEGDAAAKVSEMTSKIATMNEQGNKATSIFGDFGKMFGGFTLAGFAQQGIMKIWGSLKGEFDETIKAALEFDKAERMLNFTLEQTGKTGVEAFNKLKTAASMSQFSTVTSLMNVENELIRMGHLTNSQVINLLPVIEDFAKAVNQDMSTLATQLSTGLETGMIRNKQLRDAIATTGEELIKNAHSASELAHNYDIVFKALSSAKGAADAYAKSAEGIEAASLTERNKIREVASAVTSWDIALTKLGTGWVKFWHEQGAEVIEGQEIINAALKKTGSNTDVALKVYFEQLKKYKKALDDLMTTDALSKHAVEVNVGIQGKILAYANQRYQMTLKTADAEQNVVDKLKTYKDLISDVSEISNIISEWEKKAGQELQKTGKITPETAKNLKYFSNLDMGYKNAITKAEGKGAATAENINTSLLSGARGGLGEAKVLNIKIDSLQKFDIKGGSEKVIKEEADKAIPILIRTLNNLSTNSSGTM